MDPQPEAFTRDPERGADELGPSVADSVALSLHWSLGLNKDIIGGVHNLTDPKMDATEMFYAAAHTGVIFNYNTGEQRLLQGHVNPIMATAVSRDRKWLITADAGSDSLLVVWDRVSATPMKTILDPHPNGAIALDITPDSKFIVTLSAPVPAPAGGSTTKGPTASPEKSQTEEGSTKKSMAALPGPASTSADGNPECQSIAVWDWSSGSSAPLCSAVIGTQDIQTCILFNAWDIHELATNGRRRVFFWTWDAGQPFQFYSPALSAGDFKQRVADYTQTIFLPNSTQAATGTYDGDVVIWDLSLIVDGLSRPDERRAVKIVKLCPDVALNVLLVHTPFVVIGAADGAVRFYDYQFRIQAWFEDLSAGSVKALSFEAAEEEDTGSKDEEFRCASFLVSTASALVVLVDSHLFYELSADDRRGRLVLQGLDSPVFGLSCHPALPLLAVCGYSGFVHLWNYQSRSLHLVKIFEKLVPHTLEFSPNGKLLAVGFTNGTVKILKSDDLSESVSVRDSKECATHLAFSPDSTHLAVSHHDRCVCLYRHGHRHNDRNYPLEWMFSGKHRSHWRPIVGLSFSGPESDKHRLFSIGEDRRLVEYNVKSSTEWTGLQIAMVTQVEQEARPTGCVWYPYGSKVDNANVLTLNDEYKFKVWNATHKTCRKTALAPTYGGPVCQMIPVYKDKEGPEQFMLYSTYEKVLGLVQLPLDGNPNKCMGLIAQPGHIAAIAVDFEGKHAFTCGGTDLTINQWKMDPSPVAAASVFGGNGIEPFLKLIEGGEQGEFYSDMKDYFYYSQIRSQDENTTRARSLDGTIPVEEIPHLMCALGYFPTQLEIQNMINEVKYSKFAETGDYVDRIVFDDFFKLYVNHRPVFAVTTDQVASAFNALKTDGQPVNKDRLVQILVKFGERMTLEGLEDCLQALVGDSSVHSVFADVSNPHDFARDILGLGEEENEEDEEEGELGASAQTSQQVE